MSHMVIFRTPEGKPGYQPADTVQDAVAVVERLRNDEGVENVRIFRLEEVQFELRPYFRVELADPATDDETPADSVPAPQIFGGSRADDDTGGDDSVVEAAADDFGSSDAGESGDIGESSDAGESGDIGESGTFGDSGDDLTPPPSASHQPPWAAPPPPPAPVDPPSVADSGDELSGTGQRRGLFGR